MNKLILAFGFAVVLMGCGKSNTTAPAAAQTYPNGWTAQYVTAQTQTCTSNLNATDPADVTSNQNFCTCLVNACANGQVAYSDYVADPQTSTTRQTITNIENTTCSGI